ESVCRGTRAKDAQIPIWSAATCRRFRSDGGAIAARTPIDLVRLQLTKAAPEATPISHCTYRDSGNRKEAGHFSGSTGRGVGAGIFLIRRHIQAYRTRERRRAQIPRQ